MVRILTTALAALLLATPLAASSQELPSYAQSPQAAPGDEQIRGRITSFDGAYFLTVNDERGFVDNVDLHQGTIINPTGLTLAPGMVVSILGYNSGNDFTANEIDTPYSYDAGVPYYAGHAWDYYGPSVGLAFYFGNVGWWHGNDFRGDYRFNGGARYYNEVRISNIVRSDGYQGENGYRTENAVRSNESYRGAAPVAAQRENASNFDRSAAPLQSRATQAAPQRSAEGGAREGGHAGGGHAGGGHEGGHASGDHGGHAH
jgi:hypothetical protein